MALGHQGLRVVLAVAILSTDVGSVQGLMAAIDANRWLTYGKLLIVEPIDTVLATFLALSFCDTSTPQDHDVLFSQFHSLCLDLQSEVNGMLGKRGLASLVAPEDVNDVFHLYERLFR